MNGINRFSDNLKNFKVSSCTSSLAVEQILKSFDVSIRKLNAETVSVCKRLEKKYGKSSATDSIADFLKALSDSINNYNADIARRSKRELLKQKASENFMIIIYGKVKAGKSTLGNYIADTLSQCRKAQPKYFIFDQAGEKKDANRLEEISEFKTNITECTNSIQGFEIPGLVWIDTPGLMSMTEQNGKLAKEYAEAADLIIYPVSSDSPARQTDIDELRELTRKGKEFSVIITKSDFADEDEFDDEIVECIRNKSESDRKKQEEYTRKTIEDALTSLGEESYKNLLGDIISISVITAKVYQPGQEEWEKSNILKFFDLLNNVIEKDAIRLKREQPLKNIKKLIQNYTDGSSENSLKGCLQKMRASLNELASDSESIRKQQQDLINQCYYEAEEHIKEVVLDSAKSNLGGQNIAFKIKDEVEKAVYEIVIPKLEETLNKFGEKMIISFPVPDADDNGLEVMAKTKTISYTNKTISKSMGRATGAVAGAAVGSLFGPAGTFFGGLLGGLIGGKVGKESTSIKYKDIEIGDNLDEVEDKALATTLSMIMESIESCLNAYEIQIVTPIIGAFKEVIIQTENTIKKIKEVADNEKL